MRGLTYGWFERDGSRIASIFAALTPDPLVSKAAIINRCGDLPSSLRCVIKNSFGADLCTFFTKGTFIIFKVDFRKATVTYNYDVGFTCLDAFITPATDIGKLNIITAPRRAYGISFTAIKQASTTLVYITHVFISFN
jgi:hypothetical protein